MGSLRNQVAIIGVGDTEVGVVRHLSGTELQVKAARLALQDAGVSKDQVDGLITGRPMVEPRTHHAEMLAEYMQIFPGHCVTATGGGGTTITYLAAEAIASGRCEMVVATVGDNQLSGLTRNKAVQMMSETGHPQFEQPFGLTVPGYHALVANAHAHAYGTTMEQRAAVAVACRKHASLGSAAHMRDPITIDDVLNSKMISHPLHLLDCSLVSDGGAAIVMTSAERARDFKKKPVYLLGVGEGHWHEHVSAARSLTTSAATVSGACAYKMAGLGPKDIDVAELYDCFTSVVIIELEDLGFCAKGEGGRFVEDGRIELGGELPINTHGGLLSYCHSGAPAGIFHVTEAVRQLRGECGPRQVKDAEVALVHAQSGVLSKHTTLIFGNEQS
jgi:acetyl-CoA acetyltransferase